MWATNLKVGAVVLGTLAVFTLVSMWIPQVESEVPAELAFGADVTPEELVDAGRQLYHGAGACGACHDLGQRAPQLLADYRGQGLIGERCEDRIPGMTCKDYLHQALVEPGAHTVPGFDNIMPPATRTLSSSQIWSLVAFLESQGGEVTVTAEDIGAENGAAPAAAAAGPGVAPATASLDPRELLEQHACLACHVLAGEGGPIGPTLDGLGERRTREQIRRAILDPQADTVPGYEAVAGLMPANYGDQMTAAQLEALVAYLAGEATR